MPKFSRIPALPSRRRSPLALHTGLLVLSHLLALAALPQAAPAAPASTGSTAAPAAESPIKLSPISRQMLDWLLGKDESRREEALYYFNNNLDPAIKPALKAALRHRDAGVRAVAANLLSGYHDTGLLPDMLPLLEDRDWKVRMHATQYLGSLGNLSKNDLDFTEQPPSTVSALLPMLADEDFHVQEAAIEALRYWQDPASVPALLEALEHPNTSVRWLAIDSLGELNQPDVVPRLLPFLADEDPILRGATVKAIARLGGKAQIDAWLPLLKDEEAHHYVIEALLPLGIKPHLKQIMPLYTPNSPYLNTLLLYSYGESGDPAVVPLLVASLGHRDKEIRLKAIEAMVMVNAPTAGPSLLTALKDADTEVRLAAIEALGHLKPASARQVLVGLLASPDPAIQGAAGAALGELGDKAAVPDLLKALPTSQAQAGLSGALGKLGDPAAVPALTEVIRRKGLESTEALAAVNALALIDDKSVVPGLTLALASQDAFTQGAAMNALADRGEPAVIPVFKGYLADMEPGSGLWIYARLAALGDAAELRYMLAQLNAPDTARRVLALGDSQLLKDPQIVAAELASLAAPEHAVRVAAIEALTVRGHKPAVPKLITLLGDSHPRVRYQAAIALGKLKDPAALPALGALLQDPKLMVREAAAGSIKTLKAL